MSYTTQREAEFNAMKALYNSASQALIDKPKQREESRLLQAAIKDAMSGAPNDLTTKTADDTLIMAAKIIAKIIEPSTPLNVNGSRSEIQTDLANLANLANLVRKQNKDTTFPDNSSTELLLLNYALQTISTKGDAAAAVPEQGDAAAAVPEQGAAAVTVESLQETIKRDQVACYDELLYQAIQTILEVHHTSPKQLNKTNLKDDILFAYNEKHPVARTQALKNRFDNSQQTSDMSMKN
jgi:hypothetical protein